MKKILFIITVLICVGSLKASAQKMEKMPEAYLFSMATSLTDSVAYVSEVIALDNAWHDKTNGFLYSRDEYSTQFRNYVEKQGVSHPMAATTFNVKREKAEKKLLKMKSKLQKKGYLIKVVSRTDFAYKAVEYAAPEQEQQAETATK